MAKIDVEIRDVVLKYLIPFGLLALFVLIFLTDSVTDVKKRFFRWVMKDFSKTHDELTAEIRSALFSDLNDIESRTVDLRNRGLIRVLEIGVGSGKNLKYYPQQCRLIVVDPTLYFKQYFDENKAKFPDITLEKFIISSGERLQGVPSNSVDIVVATMVLCSVENARNVLKEIRRVLVPGGRYYFLEHFLDEYSSRRSQLQNLLTWTNIWPWLFDGCKFLPIRTEISLSGFSHVDYREFKLKYKDLKGKTRLIFNLMSSHLVGIAKK